MISYKSVKTLASAAILAAVLMLARCQFASAQEAVRTNPGYNTSTNASGSIAVTNTFQQVFAAASNSQASAGRKACSIQNNGTHAMFVFPGPLASATTATSFQIAAGSTWTCNVQNVVRTDQINITGTAADTFAADQQ